MRVRAEPHISCQRNDSRALSYVYTLALEVVVNFCTRRCHCPSRRRDFVFPRIGTDNLQTSRTRTPRTKFTVRGVHFNRATARKTDTWPIVANIEHPQVTAKAKLEPGMKTGKIVNGGGGGREAGTTNVDKQTTDRTKESIARAWGGREGWERSLVSKNSR